MKNEKQLKQIAKQIASLEAKIMKGDKKAEAEIERISCSLTVEEMLYIDEILVDEFKNF